MARKQWIWVCGKRNIFNGGKKISFADHWDAWTASIIGYDFRAPVLGRSETRDVEHDAASAPTIGVVRRYKVLTREAAAKLGFLQKDDEALYALIDLWEDAPIAHVSPSIWFNFKSETGAIWPAVIQHIAVVGQPAQQYGQPVQHDLIGVQLRRGQMPKEKYIDLEIEVEESDVVDVEDAATDVSDEAEKLLALVERLNARIEELEAKIRELTSSVPDDGGGGGDGEASEDSDLRRRLMRVETALKQERAKDLRRRFGCDRRMAIQLSRLDDDALEALEEKMTNVQTIPKQARLSRGFPGERKKKPTKSERIQMARNLSRKESISFSAALSRIDREVQ